MPQFQVSFKKVDTLKIREIFLLSSCDIHLEQQQFLLSYEMERYKIEG
jgi:hypothetical protein